MSSSDEEHYVMGKEVSYIKPLVNILPTSYILLLINAGSIIPNHIPMSMVSGREEGERKREGMVVGRNYSFFPRPRLPCVRRLMNNAVSTTSSTLAERDKSATGFSKPWMKGPYAAYLPNRRTSL